MNSRSLSVRSTATNSEELVIEPIVRPALEIRMLTCAFALVAGRNWQRLAVPLVESAVLAVAASGYDKYNDFSQTRPNRRRTLAIHRRRPRLLDCGGRSCRSVERSAQ